MEGCGHGASGDQVMLCFFLQEKVLPSKFSGGYSHMEKPEEFNSTVLTFLKTL